MAFVIPNAIEREYLESILPILTVRLFKNDRTPTENDKYSDYTEANFPGYATKTNIFAGPASTVSGIAELTSVDLLWVQSAPSSFPQTMYGYLLTDGFTLVAAEKFTTSVVIENVGDSIEFAIKATLQSVG